MCVVCLQIHIYVCICLEAFCWRYYCAYYTVFDKCFSAGPVATWQECFDDAGNPYYYNAETQESSWEPPEWIEERDASSNTIYYVHIQRVLGQLVLTSTWQRPKEYALLIRSHNAT
ncbi:hypothetical protein EON65_55970 [archaeon]|nr:MAG: hypothetical protein EON65_55970 [archaeon]